MNKQATKATWPKWARVSINYDDAASLDDYADECLSDDFRRKVENNQAWWVIVCVTDTETGRVEALGGVTTEEMAETRCATVDDLDEYGAEIVAECVSVLAHNRSEALKDRAAELVAEAGRLLAKAGKDVAHV